MKETIKELSRPEGDSLFLSKEYLKNESPSVEVIHTDIFINIPIINEIKTRQKLITFKYLNIFILSLYIGTKINNTMGFIIKIISNKNEYL